MNQKIINVGNIEISNHSPIVLISGPCVIESREHALMMAKELQKITKKLDIPFIFKSSFDKANRTSIGSFRGINFYECMNIFEEIRSLGIPVITDVHTEEQCPIVSHYVDVLQIPAFLCRQRDLLLAAGKTGLPISVKKGQWMAPENMRHVIDNISSTNNDKIMLCERGSSFGPNNLVVDMTSLEVMKQTGYPVVFDATHSVQRQSSGGITLGNREFVAPLAKAATAIGIASLFMETHDNPDAALSDAANQFRLDNLEQMLRIIKKIDNIAKTDLT